VKTIPEVAAAMRGVNGVTMWARYDVRSNMLLAAGWQEIGRGAFKRVFGRNDVDFVVKVFIDCYGCNEVANYKNAPASIKPYLLPILEHDAGWMVQKRVKTIQHLSWEEQVTFCKKHNCPGSVEGVDDSGGNNHTHAEDGTLIIFDYGQSCQWYDAAKDEEEDAA
jgi:hypothetical protein